MFASTATSRFGALPVSRRRSATVIPAVSSPRRLDVDEQRLGLDQRAVERRGHGQRIVDERAVEAVVVGVELHVEAQGVRDVPHDRVGRHGARREHRVLAARQRDRVVGRAARAPREPDHVVGEHPRALGHVEPERDRPRDGRVGSRRPRPTPGTRSARRPGRSGCSTRSSASCCRTPRTRRPSACSPCSRRGRSGSLSSASARFVSGPSVTSTISPGRAADLVDDDIDRVALAQRPRRRRQHRMAEALRPVGLGRRLELRGPAAPRGRARPPRPSARRAPGRPAC